MTNSTGTPGAPNLMMIPLLLFSLGVSIFLLAGNAWGAVSHGAYATFGLFTGGLGSLIVCVLSYRAGNPFAYVASGALASFFASSAFYHWFFAPTATDVDMNRAWISFAWAVVFGFLGLASLRAPEIPGPGKLMWILLFVFFLFRWIGPAFHVDVAVRIEAIVGFIVAFLAVVGGYVTLTAQK